MNAKIFTKYQHWLVVGFLILIQFYFRIFSFRNYSLDPDELEWFYCIKKGFLAPIPFKTFDSHTTGPCAILILIFLKFITGFNSLSGLRIVSFFFFVVPTYFFIAKSLTKNTLYLGLLVYTVFSTISNFPYFGNYYESIYCYNTEYQINLLLAISIFLIRKNKKSSGLYLLTFIIFLLPFIKFQSILLSAFLGLFLVSKHILIKEYGLVRKIISSYLAYWLILVLYLLAFNDIQLFYYSIFQRNFSHLDWNYLGQSSINPFHFFNRVTTYYSYLNYIIVTLFIYGFSNLITSNQKLQLDLRKIVLSKLFFSITLLFLTAISIILAKNDFGHYYLLLLIPSAFFVCDFYEEGIKKSKDNHLILAFFVALLLFDINYTYALKSFDFISGKILHNKRDEFQFGKKLNSICPDEVTNWLILNKKKNNTILCFGWTQAQVLYYQLRNYYNYSYRSPHSFYLEKSYETNSSIIFKFESRMIYEDIKEKRPYYIIDTDEFLKIYPGMWVSRYVKNNYKLVKKFKGFDIYCLK